MSIATARFWTAVYGAVTAAGLVIGGLVSIFQFWEQREQQLITSRLEATKSFYDKQLDVYTRMTKSAGIIAEPSDGAERGRAVVEFNQLFRGEFGTVGSSDVEGAARQFQQCFMSLSVCDAKGPGHDSKALALDLAHQARHSIECSWRVVLDELPPSSCRQGR